MWQVRHKRVGIFMGVSHGKGHYHNVSECCRSLGVYQFKTTEQIETLLEMANSPHLPDRARLKREDFIVEEWSLKMHHLLLDEGTIDDCAFIRGWYRQLYGGMGLN